MPAAWLVLCGLAVVASDAQAATVLRVVRVESSVDEFAPRVRVVVSDGGFCRVAEGAHWIAHEHLLAEVAVPSA